MIIDTSNFGQLNIDEEQVIKFKEGLPGFENEREFVLVKNTDTEEAVPFMWLQSKNNKDLALVVSIPFFFKPDYSFEIPDEICNEIELTDPNDCCVFSVCKIQDKIDNMTTNLACPIVVNLETLEARQVILTNTDYTTKEKLI